MKKCVKCNQELEDNAKFCIICGEKQPEEGSVNENSLQNQQDKNEVIADIDKSTEESLTPPKYNIESKDTSDSSFVNLYPMNWYKFIIYFQLFLNVLINIVSALRYFTGDVYGGNAEAVYNAFEGMRYLDISWGILLILLAVYCIKIRKDLALFKIKAPTNYLILTAANFCSSFFYTILASAISGASAIDLGLYNSITQLVVGIIYIILNKVYFDKRKFMFKG